jgi:lipoprotein
VKGSGKMGKGMKILIVVVSILVGCAVYNYFTKSNKKTEYTMTVSEIEAVVAVNFNELMLCKGYAMQGRKKEASDCWLANYEKTKEGTRYDTAVKEIYAMAQEDKSKQKDIQFLKIARYIDMNRSASMYILEATKE